MTDQPQFSGTERDRRWRLQQVWANWRGLGTLAAVNHSTIGMRFIVTGLLFFLVGGVLAMLLRTQLALPEQEIIAPEQYNQLFTMHGTVMMFLFAIPVLEGLAIYLIPKFIGARDLVFPRISAFGYYCYLFGGLIILSSLFLGVAPDSGWFMYTPLSGAEFSPGPGSDFWLLGITFVEISAMAAGVELTVSILRSRAPGMTLRDMPIFCWYILAMSLMIVFGFPPLILASILLELERALGWVFFAVEGGGDPLLWQHLFWLFGHPEVHIIFLPAAGIVSTRIPVLAQRPILGYRWLVIAIITTAFISFGLWVHHMFTVGIPHLAQAFFSAASMLVAIPTAIQIFAWIGTLWVGRVVRSLPMLWLFGFLVIFVCGGLTGVMLALVPFNWQVHDTHFVVAHLHYVLVGGMLFPLIAGLYYWLPLVSGRMASPLLARWGFWLTFIGFNLTFLFMHLTGLLGMPRRVFTFEAGLGWDGLNLLASFGGFIMAGGLALVTIDLLTHFRLGRPARANPWRADTLEWSLKMPPDPYNFASIPRIESRHPLWQRPDLPQRIQEGSLELADASHGWRETYGTDALSAEPRIRMHLPANSWLPLYAALGLAVVCIALLARAYPVALLGVLAAGAALLRWSWVNGGHPLAAPLTDGESRRPPWHSRTADGPGLWGMVVALLADGTLYLSLLFGWFYLWVVAGNWQAPDGLLLPWSQVAASAVLVTAATLAFSHLVKRLRRGMDDGLAGTLLAIGLVGCVHWIWLCVLVVNAGLEPARSAHDAVFLFAWIYLLAHTGLVSLLTLLQARRAQLGLVSARLPYEPGVVRPLWVYVTGIHWLTFALFLLLPLAWGGGA